MRAPICAPTRAVVINAADLLDRDALHQAVLSESDARSDLVDQLRCQIVGACLPVAESRRLNAPLLDAISGGVLVSERYS